MTITAFSEGIAVFVTFLIVEGKYPTKAAFDSIFDEFENPVSTGRQGALAAGYTAFSPFFFCLNWEL